MNLLLQSSLSTCHFRGLLSFTFACGQRSHGATVESAPYVQFGSTFTDLDDLQGPLSDSAASVRGGD